MTISSPDERTEQQKSKADTCRDCVARPWSAFANLSEDDLVQMDAIRSLVKTPTGKVLPEAISGKAGFYCVRAGLIKISSTSQSNKMLSGISGRGDLLLFNRSPELAERSFEAVAESQACFIPERILEASSTGSGTIVVAVIRKLWQMIADRDQRIARLQKCSVSSRVAAMLIELADKFGTHDARGTLIDTRMDRGTLAELSGTVAETLSRALTTFERERFILRVGNKIRIINREGLRRFSES
jgi:CRP-like cAMP-binding protein